MSLMDEFIANQGRPIHRRDRDLYWTYMVPVATGDRVQLRFRDFATSPLQGLAVDCDDCLGRIGGSQSKSFQLWTDTAPEVVMIEVERAEPGAHLAFFNVWSIQAGGPMLYRLNDAAMEIRQQSPETILLCCNDGVGPPTFADLVVELTRLSSSDPTLR